MEYNDRLVSEKIWSLSVVQAKEFSMSSKKDGGNAILIALHVDELLLPVYNINGITLMMSELSKRLDPEAFW